VASSEHRSPAEVAKEGRLGTEIFMKTSKQVVVGLVALVLVLLGYSVLTTVRVNNLEERLKRLESSHLELEARHADLADMMLRPETSRVAAAEARVMLIRESLKLPPATVHETHPSSIEVNSTPQDVRSK
jgi:hypothetical protein